MNLKNFQEISISDSTLIPNAANRTNEVRSEFLRQVANKGLVGITHSTEQYEGKEYIVFLKPFGRIDKAAFAFHIAPFGSQDLAVETRYFEFAQSSRMKNQAKGFMGVVGNIAKGFMMPGGRSWGDEKNLFSNMGQAITGGGTQVLGEKERKESQMILQSLISALENALELSV